MKKSQIEQKQQQQQQQQQQQKANYALQNVRTNSRCMVDEKRLESFMTEVPIIQKLAH